MIIDVDITGYKSYGVKDKHSQRNNSLINAKKAKLLHEMLSMPKKSKVIRNRNMTHDWFTECEQLYNNINGNTKLTQNHTIKSNAFDILVSYLESDSK